MKKRMVWVLMVLLIGTSSNVGARQVSPPPTINSIVSGRVIDASSRKALEGTTIQIKGTTNTTLTDAAGNFVLRTGQTLPFTVLVSNVGFQSLEFQIKEQNVTIELQAQEVGLDEVVVTGYTTQSRRSYTGSSSKVTAAQLENRPAQNFSQLLGGQAAGVDLVQSSGALNNPPVLRIRGVNSISSSLYPLVVVDGVVVFTGSAGGAIGNDPLSDINPGDIESVDILKDASATAIYGSRAANGVLVITTKKGKKGKTRVAYDNWVGLNRPFNLPKLLGAEDYVTIKNEARVNAGLAPGFVLGTDANGHIIETDWYDVAYRTALSQQHNISFSGANDATRYFLSLNYSDQEGILRTNEFTRQSVRLNLEHKLHDRITVGTNSSYSHSVNEGPNSGAIPPNSIASSSGNSVNSQFIGLQPLGRLTYILPPNVPVYNADGSYNINTTNGNIGYGPNSPTLGVFNAYNLQTILDLDRNSSVNNKFLGNIYAEVRLLKGLHARTSYGLDRLTVENKEFRNPYSGDGFSRNGSATNSQATFFRSTWTNTLRYNQQLGQKHRLDALVGHEETYREIDGWGANRTGLSDPFYTNYQGGWTNIVPSGNIYSENGLLSYFATVSYDYDNRYLVTLNARRDGLSALAPGRKWGNFGGGSLGWNLFEESFFKQSALTNWIDALKLRVSYGVVGNSSVDDYAALSQFSSSTYAGVPTLFFSQAGNEVLKWESSKKFNAGLSISLLNRRIQIEADYYKNTIDGLILNAPQSSSQGIPGNAIAANVGSLYNKGLELGITATIISKSSFQWNANLQFSTLKNRVTSLGDGGDIYSSSLATFGIQNMTRAGYSVGSIFAVPSPGVNPENGNRLYINSNNEQVQYDAVTKNFYYLDGTLAPRIDNYADGRILAPSLPTYFGGLTNNFSLGRFDASVLLTFSGGNKLYNGTRATISDQRYFNSGEFVLDRWQRPGDVTTVHKLVWGDNFSNGFSSSNSAYVEDGSYLKLKNLLIAYRIPIEKTAIGNWLSSARVFVQGSNLVTLTQYKGADPEISINGNSINGGKDQNVPVNAVSYAIGLNISF